MRLLDAARRRLVPTAAACGAVVGIVIGLFLPIRAAAPSRGSELDWRLPSPQSIRRFDQAQYETLKTAGFWNTQATPRDGKPAADAWTLLAIMARPIAQVAVSAPGARKQAWVRLGGTLPDGATLVAIDGDRIWFEEDGCRRVKQLYAAADKASAGKAGSQEGCIGQAADSARRPPAKPASRPASASSGDTPSNGK